MKFTIGRKLGLGFAMVLGLMIISSGLVYFKARDIRDVDARAEIHTSTQKALFEMQRDLNQTMSKGRQATLAGTEQARRDAARKLFNSAWDDCKKDVAQLDELAPKWFAQETRDRWGKAKEVLPNLREAQEASMDLATGANANSVIQGGNYFADKATSVNEPLMGVLGEMADSSTALAEKSKEVQAAANSSM